MAGSFKNRYGDNMRTSKVPIAGIGIVMIIIGAIWTTCLHFWLAFTDSEYAKHDESLYATISFFTHGGWLPTIIIMIGIILYIIFKND